MDVSLSNVICESTFECDDFGVGPATYEVGFIVSGGFPPYTIINAYTGEVLEEESFDGGSYTSGGIPSAIPYKFIVVDARGLSSKCKRRRRALLSFSQARALFGHPYWKSNDPTGNYTTDFDACVGKKYVSACKPTILETSKWYLNMTK